MTVESLKSELQQVLDNDLILRKEFNELKRSLSDYRNQLIMRDEDCKRLQVTIDVLNTKLVVMERDNNNYKAELTSFKELRSTIKDQLQDKQQEIEQRLTEIQSLKDDLNSLASGYELKIEEIKNEASLDLKNVKEDYQVQIGELKAVSAYKEQAIKEEFENRINDLTIALANKEQSFEINFQETLSDVNSKHELELSGLKKQYELNLQSLSAGSREEIDSLIATNQQTISELQTRLDHDKQLLESQYVGEISNLRLAIEEQRQTLTNNFNHQLEAIKNESTNREEKLVAGYEARIEELNGLLSNSTNELSGSFQKQIAELTSSHQALLDETNTANSAKINSLINDYEEKLSVTLIHSNSQNSKLNEELAHVRNENESAVQQIQDLTLSIDLKTSELTSLSNKIAELENQLVLETSKFNQLNTEFEEFKSKALLSNTEKVNELIGQLEALQLEHANELAQLNNTIENQNLEISNLGLILEATSNQLSTNEGAAEEKLQELQMAQQKLIEIEATLNTNQLAFDNQIASLNQKSKVDLESKNLEFEKLLNENSQLIAEIEESQLMIENKDAELSLLKSELEEVKTISAGKTEDLKEIISNKNFEITNLEGAKAALSEELVHTKMEILSLENQVSHSTQNSDLIHELSSQIETITNEKDGLLAELNLMNSTVSELKNNILNLNYRIISYETDMEQMKLKASSEDQDAFIDRLFKQIDGLNDERLVLLEEKEQMAYQLLKMNDVISTISQQVDSEKINVKDLNNHRKNVILASNSNDQQERSQMKEQINDLVREIDKCIALLSA